MAERTPRSRPKAPREHEYTVRVHGRMVRYSTHKAHSEALAGTHVLNTDAAYVSMLYMSKHGNYFVVHFYAEEGQEDAVLPVEDIEDARRLYEEWPRKYVAAFPEPEPELM